MIRKLQSLAVTTNRVYRGAVCWGMVLIGTAWVTVGSLPAVSAQSGSANDPAMIVALKDISGQLEDVKFLGEKAGFPDEVAMVPMLARGFLGGVDLKKPVGVAVWFDGEEPVGVGMVPVTDIEQVLDQLSGFGVNVDEEGEFYFLETPAEDMVIRVKGGYAFIANTQENLANLPADPAAMLGAVSKDYTLAAKLFVQRIPAELREMAIEQMQEGFQSAMDEMDEEALADLQREANEMQIKQLIELVENSDVLDVGFGVRKSSDHLVFDMQFTGLPGSKMAQQAEAAKGKSSKFSKFLVDSAAMSMNGFGVMLKDDIQSTKALLANLQATAMKELENDEKMSSVELELVKGVLGDLFSVLESTVDGGLMDFGGAMMMDETGANFSVGGLLANPTKFDELIAKVSGIAKTQNEVAIEVSEASVAGIGMKKMVVTLPESVDREAIDMFGERITILLGRQSEAAYMALGSDPAGSLETIIKNTATAAGDTSMEVQFRVVPILKFASRSPQASGILGPLLNGFKSQNDRIKLSQKMIPNGMAMQGSLDADLIKLFTDLGQMMQGGMGGAEF